MFIKIKLIYLLISFLYISILPVYSQIWKIDKGFEHEDPHIGTYSDLYDHIEVLMDSTGTITYSEITTNQLPFNNNNTKEGYHKDKVYWLKTIVQGSAVNDGRYLFSIGMNTSIWPTVGYTMRTWPYIDIYLQEGDSVKIIKTGFKRSPIEKIIQNAFSYFWVDLKANERKTLYARLDPDGGLWYKESIPKNISIYFFDSSSIDLFDRTYFLRNFDNDPINKNGSPRQIHLFEIMQIYPDSSCEMNLEDVMDDWNSQSIILCRISRY